MTMEHQTEKEAVMENENADVQNNNFPKEFTMEPTNQEQMHLRHISHSPALIEIYGPVSDDKGEFIGDMDSENKIINFINAYSNKEIFNIEKPAVVISELQNLVKTYGAKIDKSYNISIGITTKCKIRIGMLHNIEKKLLSKKGKDWIEHYNSTYGKSTLRSAQDYMKLATVPKIISYAFIGKERLMEMLRGIKFLNIKGDDPIASLLDQYGIKLDVGSINDDSNMDDLKFNIDFAVAATKVKKAEKDKSVTLNIDNDLLKRVIKDGVNVNNGVIEDLFIIQKEGDDVNQYLSKLCNSAEFDESNLNRQKDFIGFSRLIANLKKSIEDISQDRLLLSKIEQTQIEELDKCIADFKTLIQSNGVANN